jgi:hypothetical protein
MSDQSLTSGQPASPEPDRVLDLAAGYCDGLATAAEVADLEAMIVSSPEARREFLAFALLHGQLSLAAEVRKTPGGLEAEVGRDELSGAARPSRWPPAWLFRAAVVLVASVAAAGYGLRALWPAGADDLPALATVTETRFAVSADAASPLEAGQRIDAGRITIDSGAVQIKLRNGVSILLDGPADLELVSEMRAVLRDGSVVVRVPKGMSGFLLETASAEVLDLGTEFAVRASGGQLTDVQVYEGAVVASHAATSSRRSFPHRVSAGEAVRFGPGPAGDPERIPYDEDRFLRALPPEPAMGQAYESGTADAHKFGTPAMTAIPVVAMEHPPAIDGRLDDWPGGPGFRAWYRRDPAAAEWIEGRMAHDREHLYLAARVGDPFPLRSHVDPDLDPDKGWTGGGVQVRISTDRMAGWPVAGNSHGYYWAQNRPVLPTPQEKAAATNPRLNHLVMWHHAPTGRACLSIAHGMTYEQHAGNPSGYRGAFAPFADGTGYTLEYAIPWALLEAADDPPRAGDVLAAAWQAHFADASGRVWRRQIFEVRNLEEPYRIGIWQRAATWGRAEFE